jgi:hypothetical protein
MERLEPRIELAASHALPPIVFEGTSTVTATLAVDVDGDGNDDLVVGAGNQISLLRGHGDGTFEPAVVKQLMFEAGSVVTGSFDGEPDLEFVSVGPRGTADRSIVRILKYDEQLGRFMILAKRNLPGTGIRVLAANLVGGADLDEIVLTQGTRSRLYNLEERSEDGRLVIRKVTELLPGSGGLLTGPVAGDLDGDGRDELVFGAHNLATGVGRILVFSSDGLPDPHVTQTVLLERANRWFPSVLVGDLNGDGRTDILYTDVSPDVSQTNKAVAAFLNTANGLSEEPSTLHVLHEDADTLLSSAELVGLGRTLAGGWREVLVHRLSRVMFGSNPSGSAPLFLKRMPSGTFVGSAGFDLSFGVKPLMTQGDFAGDGRPDVIWSSARRGLLGDRVRVIMNSASNAAPTIERFHLPVGTVARGDALRLVARPMDAEFLLGRAEEPDVAFYLDTNGNGELDAGDRHMITGRVRRFHFITSPRLSVRVGKDWELGTFMVFAQAIDSRGAASAVRLTMDGQTMGRVTIV